MTETRFFIFTVSRQQLAVREMLDFALAQWLVIRTSNWSLSLKSKGSNIFSVRWPSQETDKLFRPVSPSGSGACPQQQKWALDANSFQPQNPYHQGPLVISAAAKTVPARGLSSSSTGPCLQSSVSWSPRCFPSFLFFPQSSGWEWLCVCVCLSVCLMSKPWDFLERYLLQKQLSYHC